jgi:multidrug efflux pump subunit AcrA (membrane-fusion protein)
MSYALVYRVDLGSAQSPFRVVAQPTGREVGWINRFLDQCCVRGLAWHTLRGYAFDLTHFVRWWADRHATDDVTEQALTTSSLLDYMRYQVQQQPRPAANTINKHVWVAERALRCQFPDVVPPAAPGVQQFYWRQSALGYPNETFRARVTRIADTVNSETRTIKVSAELDNSAGRLRPEMFGRLRYADGLAPASWVPDSAVVRIGNKDFVFVEQARGRFASSPVELGKRHDGGFVVSSGVKAGDRVVTHGSVYLKAAL